MERRHFTKAMGAVVAGMAAGLLALGLGLAAAVEPAALTGQLRLQVAALAGDLLELGLHPAQLALGGLQPDQPLEVGIHLLRRAF